MPSKSHPLKRGAHASFLDAAFSLQRCNAIGSEEQRALFGFNDHVFEVGMKGQRAIVRNGPGRSRPDNRADIGSDVGGCASAADDSPELHPDGRAGVIFVFHFGFCECGAVKEAPIDRLAPAIHVTLFHEVEKSPRNGGFIVVAHRQVRIVPAAENSQSLEIFLILLDVARRKFPAQFAELRRGDFTFSAQLFFNLSLDQASRGNPTPARKARSAPPCFCS